MNATHDRKLTEADLEVGRIHFGKMVTKVVKGEDLTAAGIPQKWWVTLEDGSTTIWSFPSGGTWGRLGDFPLAKVERYSAPSGDRDADYWRAACTACDWVGTYHSNRTIEGRQLAKRDAQQHRCH